MSAQQQPVKKNVAWANTIKNQHNKIRAAVTTSGAAASAAANPLSEEAINETYSKWRQQRDGSQEDLKAYATAMHDLATQFWSQGGGIGVLSKSGTHAGDKRPREGEEGSEAAATEELKPASPASEFSTTTGRYDDRVAIVVDAVKDYFFGEIERSAVAETTMTVTSEGTATTPQQQPLFTHKKFPVMITKDLRNARRSHFEAHGVQLPLDEELKAVDALIAGGGTCMKEIVGPAVEAVRNTTAVTSSSSSSMIPLNILDVGSCYGPYRGHFDEAAGGAYPFAVKGTHIDVDLCPYEGSGVYQCDWLDCKFHEDDASIAVGATNSGVVGEDAHPADNGLVLVKEPTAASPAEHKEGENASTTLSATSVRSNSFHVVVFCFMLSYLPTREMRLRSCFNALRALKHEGVLCIVSTRTQGPRSGRWVEPWTACIEGLGFRIAQKVIKSKVILLTFQKVVKDLPAEAEMRAAVVDATQSSSSYDALVEAYYRKAFLPLLEKYPEGMSLHEQSM